jgi:hypothetical protein
MMSHFTEPHFTYMYVLNYISAYKKIQSSFVMSSFVTKMVCSELLVCTELQRCVLDV